MFDLLVITLFLSKPGESMEASSYRAQNIRISNITTGMPTKDEKLSRIRAGGAWKKT